MKQLNQFIQEKLRIDKNIEDQQEYSYYPQNREELIEVLKNLIKERGNKANLNDIDTSKITNMNCVFLHSKFNGDISKWDVSSVKTMFRMFGVSDFNGDISNWDVSNVIDMEYMFISANNFNQDLSKWDVSNVKNMHAMFYNCPLEKNPPKWYKD